MRGVARSRHDSPIGDSQRSASDEPKPNDISAVEVEASVSAGCHLDDSGLVASPGRDHGKTAESISRLVVAAERITAALERIASRSNAIPKVIDDGSRDEVLLDCQSNCGSNAVNETCVLSADPHGSISPSPGAHAELISDRIKGMEHQISEIRDLLKRQVRLAGATDRKSYTVDEVAELTEYKPWTLRQACNKGRIRGQKGDDGRWRVPREEVARLQECGLPPE